MAGASGYSQKLALCICEEIAKGRSLRSICSPDNMPAASTVCLWLTEHKDFAEQYTRAREAQADFLAEDTIEIADNATNDWMATNDPENPGYTLNGEHVQRSRLRVDARKWFASKVAPKKYGEKIGLEHSGEINLGLADRIKAARARK